VAPILVRAACAGGIVRTDADLVWAGGVVGTAAAEDVGSDALVTVVEFAEPHPASVIAAADSASSVQPQPRRNLHGRASAAEGVTASEDCLSVRAWIATSLQPTRFSYLKGW
jgi:hypothetical protein